MTLAIAHYKDLMQGYLDRGCTAKAFVTKFIETFKDEEREMDEYTFEVLDDLFGVADSFTNDAALLSERPDFYVDENGLREQVAQALTRLS